MEWPAHLPIVGGGGVTVVAAAIAQASATGSQRGPSNLQRFKAHHPPKFTGGGDPMVADLWFMQIEKVLESMKITSNTNRIRLAAFQLEGEAQVWWNWAKTSRDLEAMTWAEFQELFMGKYFLDTARPAKAQEFLELKQGTMTVMDYVARFTELDTPPPPIPAAGVPATPQKSPTVTSNV